MALDQGGNYVLVSPTRGRDGRVGTSSIYSLAPVKQGRGKLAAKKN